MPKLIYKPEGIEPMVFDVDFEKIPSGQRITIEKMTGMTWGQIKASFGQESTLVIHALLYTMVKLAGRPDLKANEFEFCGDEFEVGITDREARKSLEYYTDHPHEVTDEVADAMVEWRAQLGPEAEEIEPDPKESTTA